MLYSKRTFGALVALAILAAFPLLGADESHFSVAVGSHDNLLISGPGGETVADLAGQTVDKAITIGSTALQVSYGRDANGELTAILASSDSSTVALHFSAGGKTIDAEKAVVTLTFSSNLKGVLVDPGYVGTVEVDSHVLRPHSLADDLPMPIALASAPSDAVVPNLAPSRTAATAPSVPSANVASETAPVASPDASVVDTTPDAASAPQRKDDVTPAPASTPAPGSTQLATVAAAPEMPLVVGGDLSTAPAPLASQLAPILPPSAGSISQATTGSYVSVTDQTTGKMVQSPSSPVTQEKLYWSEPVTAPDGTAPSVASDEIRLVEVHGTVTITVPGGVEQTGSEGTLVPSGATVHTADNSSAALFMGGVNSARLMPNCELVVTQALSGTTRTDSINLEAGAVFSRIGQRDGETENYTITTPEGTTAAQTNDMLAYRGAPDDLRPSPITTTRLDLGRTHLLAWNPSPSHGLISDVPGWDMGSVESSKKSSANTYFYYCQSGGSVQSDNVRNEVLCKDDDKNNDKDKNSDKDGGKDKDNGKNNDKDNGRGGDNDRGWGDNQGGHGDRDNHHHDPQPQYVLQQILETLQPYNTKLKAVLTSIDNGTATTAEKKFYNKLISVFFCIQEPNIVNTFENDKKKFDKNIGAYDRILRQDLREFGLPCLTPH